MNPTTAAPPPGPCPSLPSDLAAAGIRARHLADVNGLQMHVLEAGFDPPGRPLLLLLHGFPELAYSWRRLMPRLAAAGYHVVAPDQRGYGRTTGWTQGWIESPPEHPCEDLASFRLIHLADDALHLVQALGCSQVAAVVGHDFGAPVAAWCALMRPDVFKRLVLMSAPFGGPPAAPPTTQTERGAPAVGSKSLHQQLAALPRPRKHYQWYFSQPEANAHLLHAAPSVQQFLRAYFHHKSADWPHNNPHALASWRAEDLAVLPDYYLMDLDKGMWPTVAPVMPSAAMVARNAWLPDADLAFYSAEFSRTGFQGGLNWYRCASVPSFVAEQQNWAGRSVDVPALFIAGAQDWGVHQKPGEFDRMQRQGCTCLMGVHLLPGAGHWVQQEQAPAVAEALLDFLQTSA